MTTFFLWQGHNIAYLLAVSCESSDSKVLQNRWSPTYDVAAILTSIQSLLHDPNPNSPANAEAAQLYRENMKEYVRRVRATVEDSWLDPEEQAAMEQHPSGQA